MHRSVITSRHYSTYLKHAPTEGQMCLFCNIRTNIFGAYLVISVDTRIIVFSLKKNNYISTSLAFVKNSQKKTIKIHMI